MRSLFRLILLSSLFVVTFGTVVRSQTAIDDDDTQSWNDLQLTVKLNAHFDLTTKLTGRFGRNISRLNDGRYQIGFVWKPTKSISVSPFYWFVYARNAAGKFTVENRLNLAVTYKFPVKSFGLSHRSWYEYRVKASGNSWRYRPSLTFEKALPEKFLSKAKFFITEEPFYVSTTRKFSRNRLSLGISKVINNHLTLDVYYLRQNDGFSHPGDLNVLGTSWKFHL